MQLIFTYQLSILMKSIKWMHNWLNIVIWNDYHKIDMSINTIENMFAYGCVCVQVLHQCTWLLVCNCHKYLYISIESRLTVFYNFIAYIVAIAFCSTINKQTYFIYISIDMPSNDEVFAISIESIWRIFICHCVYVGWIFIFILHSNWILNINIFESNRIRWFIAAASRICSHT